MFTERECCDVHCAACKIVNRRNVKVPAVKDARRESLKPGELAYQDLIKMPKGLGAFLYASVIVDAHTRRVAAKALKSKDEAIDHCISYVRRLETEGMQVKEWRSDNGGEFANEEYKAFLRSKGISQEFGAPYTPQSQGLVERANGVFKRLMEKVLRSLGLPVVA
jgi:transposase InsO family protein